jgi:adenosylcobyric acid synthase
MAKALMIQGTGSGAGKSVIVAGLCRIFRDMGIKVAPFKAQNMALNSFITKEGGEIGRAQALQAEAAGIEPCTDMNPVLLKATGEAGSQVIFNGTVFATMKAEEYYAIKDRAWNVVTAAYDRLSKQYDLIIIEGAGSPAEINLQEEEIVNMRVARYTDAAVILVGDIDKGGLFASLYGTVELLRECIHENGRCDADYIKAFVVNKFRGNVDILRPGLRMLERKTGKLFIGVIPHAGDLALDEEDGLSVGTVKSYGPVNASRSLKIVALRLKYMANFTDFAPLMHEPDVEFKYSLSEQDIKSADLLIIPGSKNTVMDLQYLREQGIEDRVKDAAAGGTPLVGVCGGYQMLGRKIFDPDSVESSTKEIEGVSLLNIATILNRTKTTCQVSAELMGGSTLFPALQGSAPSEVKNLRGYEIHMGTTTGDVGLFRLCRSGSSGEAKRTVNNPPSPPFSKGGMGGFEILDGSAAGNVWGTYIHGIFDNDEFRRLFLNSIREKKGLPLQEQTFHFHETRQKAIDGWADIVKRKMDICFLLRQLGMGSFHSQYCKVMKT